MALKREESTHRFDRIWKYVAETEPVEAPESFSLRSLALLSLRTGILLALFLALEWWLLQISQLPPESYERESLLGGLLTLRWAQLIVALIAVTTLVLVRPLWIPWSDLDQGRFVRAFMTLIASILSWTYSTYDLNLYLGQAHIPDRILLVILVFLVYWRPVFIFPYLVILLTVIGQFSEPLPWNPLAEEFLLIRILIVFLAAFLVQILSGSRRVNDLAFCLLVLVGAHYFGCGLQKAAMGWITHGHIYHLMLSTYANGWLGFLEPSTITSVVDVVSRFDWPMRVGTLAAECGAIALLWRRVGLRILLGGWVLFHCGVFALSGICFWKWTLVDAALLAFFLGRERSRELTIFTRPRFALSVLLIGTGFLWTDPPALSWFDVPFCYTYRLEALGEKGNQRYHLPPRFFAPYAFQFTLGFLGNLVDAPQPKIIWGSVGDRDLARTLLELGSAEEFWDSEKRRGQNDYDEAQAIEFDRFISTFVANFNQRGTKRVWWDRLQPPRQLWTFPTEVPFVQGERIRKVVVVQVTTFYDGERFAEIRRRQIREIEIPR